MKNKKPGRAKKIVAIVGCSFIGVLTIVLNVACLMLSSTLDVWGAYTQVNVDPEAAAVLEENSDVLGEQIEAEGMVLVENDGTLPLAKGSEEKVNVFGWGATQWVYGGSGSGRVSQAAQEVDFLDALGEYGVSYNEELISFYRDFQGERPLYNDSQGALHSYTYELSVLYEPKMDQYSESLLDNAKSYSDTAFVVLTRVTGESNDCPREQYYVDTKGGAKQTDETRTYLDPSDAEEDLLAYVEGNFENVVVIINSTNAMNLSFLKEYEVDAALVVGCTGSVGARAIPKAIYGEVNPSGHLTDTYLADFSLSPSFTNIGPEEDAISTEHNRYDGSAGYYPADGTNYGNVSGYGATYSSAAYVDYVEDIYVGYKYYETRYADWAASDETAADDWYAKAVCYPFGYGLSYTSFTHEITSVTSGNLALIGSTYTYSDTNPIIVTVSVTNTGNVAGKDAIELYLTRPYTSGGIEKPHVELVGFAKTDSLAVGETKSYQIEVDSFDLASYDCYDKNSNRFAGYEIEEGNYAFKVGHSAHEIIDEVSFTISSPYHISNDPITGNSIENRFDGNGGYLAEAALDGSTTEGDAITYLSRADFEGTFQSELPANRTFTDLHKKYNVYTAELANAYIDEEAEEVTFGKDNGRSIMAGNTLSEAARFLVDDDPDLAEYQERAWDELLDQVNYEEALDSFLHGYTQNMPIDSISKPSTRETDGPAQVGSFNAGSSGKGYPNGTVLGQTWNQELAREYGKQLGKEAKVRGYDGLYAPGANFHRTAFCGRNFEYPSEDAYLTGKMVSENLGGCLDMGVYCYVKHFVLYEQETFRDGLYTFLTEQNLRENYLKPFRMAVKDGNLTAIMTSYNRIGLNWAGGDYQLIHELLQGEWGFRGSILTDYADHHVYMNPDMALRAGGSLFMDGFMGNGSFDFETSSNSFKQALRQAVKSNVYNYLKAKDADLDYQESGATDFIVVSKNPTIYWWKFALVGYDVLAVISIIFWLFMVFVYPSVKAERALEKEQEQVLESGGGNPDEGAAPPDAQP